MMQASVCGCALLLLATAAAGANDWENPAVNSRFRLPERTYAMPLADERAAFTDDIEPATPWKLSLNGTWKFKWAGHYHLRVWDFWKVGYDDSAWGTVDVPSCLETRGYGSPQYTNIDYPHMAKGPTIRNVLTGLDDYNPVGSYRRRFTVPESWRGRRVILRFDGVYSAYQVWVNGRRVGYAEDSMLPSEFDITDCLNVPSTPSSAPSTKHQPPSTNLLCVEAYRWSDGSFLEDQDTFRFHGIYRDVTLWSMPKDGIWDFAVKTKLTENYTRGMLAVEGIDGDWSATLYDAEHRAVGTLSSTSQPLNSSTSQPLTIPAVHLWSAEKPYLYTLVVRKGEDIRMRRVGFKEQRIDGNRFLVNGRPVKLHGVNRCETSPDGGRTVTLADMVQDITMFKRYNIDTVRTSHYPNHHLWYDLCDRYGVYVMSEANIETHGLNRRPKDNPSHLPEWAGAFVERNERHVRFYRNHPSVTIWSLGNEACFGAGLSNALTVVRALDPTRPTACNHEGGNAFMDIEGGGYQPPEWLEKVGKAGARPYFFIEYAHAMGNALGNFAEYWEVFDRYDRLFGGCVWDWADQAVWKYTDRVDPATGRRERYLGYGGDWDENPHSGNFCVNGIVNPLREVSPKLLEVAHCHRPLAVTRQADGSLLLRNRLGFTFADEYDGRWELVEDGIAVKGGAFAVPHLAPLTTGPLSLPVPPCAAGKECFLNVSFATKADTRWAKKGWVVARNQVRLTAPTAWTPRAAAPSADGVRIDAANPRTVRVEAGDTTAVFSRATGTLCELVMGGVTVLKDPAPGLAAGPLLTCGRALVDNDRWLRDWGDGFMNSGLTQLSHHPSPLVVSGNTVRVTTAVDGAHSAGFRHDQVWTFFPDGTIELGNVTMPHGTMPKQLPRFGLSLRLDPALEHMAYYGRGPHENYVDRRRSAFFGLWRSTVTEQYVDYLRPQDNGYRTDLRWVAFTDGQGRGVRFSSSFPLHVQALHYSLEDLVHARHRDSESRVRVPLAPRPEVFLNLDFRQCGLGGASCGPRPMAKYLFPTQPETWTVRIEKAPPLPSVEK